MIFIGIDVGSISTKSALLKDGELVAENIIMTGYNASKAARNVYEGVLSEVGLSPSSIAGVVATGYGRNSVEFADRSVTEITCHAAGARYLNPEVRSVIDIGGQDSKVIALNDSGRVLDFVMNDKCAAGTGRFLEVMARALEVDLDDFGAISLQANNPASISSLCTVFAESEVISLISKGETRENIIAGIHESIVARVVSMAGRTALAEPIMMTGGVSQNIGVVKAFENKIGKPILVSKKAQIAGAIGAALVAAE
ncbi:MAG: acyl-CoA dehydratase activase [Pseudomonadota bacterium]